jgi:hypothetical protein
MCSDDTTAFFAFRATFYATFLEAIDATKCIAYLLTFYSTYECAIEAT